MVQQGESVHHLMKIDHVFAGSNDFFGLGVPKGERGQPVGMGQIPVGFLQPHHGQSLPGDVHRAGKRQTAARRKGSLPFLRVVDAAFVSLFDLVGNLLDIIVRFKNKYVFFRADGVKKAGFFLRKPRLHACKFHFVHRNPFYRGNVRLYIRRDLPAVSLIDPVPPGRRLLPYLLDGKIFLRRRTDRRKRQYGSQRPSQPFFDASFHLAPPACSCLE